MAEVLVEGRAVAVGHAAFEVGGHDFDEFAARELFGQDLPPQVLLERRADLRAGAVEQDTLVVDGDAEGLGDFVAAEALDVSQGDDGRLRGGQTGDGVEDELARIGAEGERFGRTRSTPRARSARCR